MDAHLTDHQHKTLDSIFMCPPPHNLEWPDVMGLLRHIGTLEKRPNGGLNFSLGAEHTSLATAHETILALDDIQSLQTFLRKIGFDPTDTALWRNG